MNSPVQTIKERLSIIDVVSSYIKVEKAGSNLKAKCPFHNEKTPSFFISPARSSYYCFGCGAKGDIFTFVEEFEGLDFKGALKVLADRAGVSLSDYSREKDGEKEKLHKVMEAATMFFERNLEGNKEALSYLEGRGLTRDSIKNFRIGYISPNWRDLYAQLSSQGYSDKDIELAGLAKKSEKATPTGRQGYYDRFRGRIMFPISDSSGRVIAFSGRIFPESLPTPEGIGKPTVNVGSKYLNSPDTPIFSKSSVLYGLDKAKESIRKNNFSILVEGQMDLILSHQAGFKNTIASSGTALSDATYSRENVVSNLGLVRRLSDNIVLAFDSDRAGISASLRAAKIALALGMDVKVAKMAEGVDPADLIRDGGEDAWRKAIRESKHIIEFMLEKVLKDKEGDPRKAGREIKEKVLPFISAIESSIEKMHFIKKISDESQIGETALKEDLEKVEEVSKGEKQEIQVAKETLNKGYRKDYIERRLLGIVLWQSSMSEPRINVENTLKDLSEIFNIDPDKILEKAEVNKEDLIFEADIFYGGDVDLKKDTKELISNLKEEYLKERLFKKMQELHVVEEKNPSHDSSDILKEINEINSQIQNIKNSRSNNKYF